MTEAAMPAASSAEVSATGHRAPEVRVLGVRHHGPGSARGVDAALAEFKPDVVLIEGPADADPLAVLAGLDTMEPPVALLAYAVDDPSAAVFWPFAAFSPEWRALRWAAGHDVPVRFCDLPATAVLALRQEEAQRQEVARPDDPHPAGDQGIPSDQGTLHEPARAVRADPLAHLARAAGYDDPERWWDDVVESRHDGTAAFEAITAAMAELRADGPGGTDGTDGPADPADDPRREAYMRTVLRSVLKDGATRVAVVCGAWHAPALTGALTGKLPGRASDAALLRGLPKRKAQLTWVPWTHSRLAVASGYGAGVTSPGWYDHLFRHPDDTVVRWFVRVAAVLRERDLPVSSAHVIEATRLAEALAGMRARRLAGLSEVTEAARAVLCDGDDLLLRFVTGRLVVGERLGAVPPEAPMVPLEGDLRARAKTLRLPFTASTKELDLDLRREIDRERSNLLHRLSVLGIDWGTPAASRVRGTGTFRESWSLTWAPELSVDLVLAARWGTTVASAATARMVDRAGDPEAGLADLAKAVEACLPAGLDGALPPLLSALQDRAALDLDIEHLMAALPPLVRTLRYGDVRGTDVAALGPVVDGLLLRICVGLPVAVGSLDDAAAAALRKRLDAVHAAVLLREHEPSRQRWLATLKKVADREDVHGLITGRLVRVLRDTGATTSDDAARRFGFALSTGAAPSAKAAWVDGFLDGGGTVLAHDPALLAVLDRWVASLGEQTFVDVLPLVRRTFSGFASGERRIVGEQVRRLRSRPASSGSSSGSSVGPGSGTNTTTAEDDASLPPEVRRRQDAAVATVAALLGLPEGVR